MPTVRLAPYNVSSHDGEVDLSRSLGADHVVEHTRTDVTDGDRRFDLILDIGGGARSWGGRPRRRATFTLAEVPVAVRHLVAGRARGKLVIDVATDAR